MTSSKLLAYNNVRNDFEYLTCDSLGKIKVANTDVVDVLNDISDNTGVTNTKLDTINSKMSTLGQKTMSSSVPVVVASDQSNLDIVIHDSQTDMDTKVAPFGDLRTTQLTRIIGGSFDGTTLDTFIWSVVNSNGATSSMASGAIKLDMSSNIASSSILESVNPARFQSAFANQFLCGIILSSVNTLNNTCRWGAYDASNGFFFELASGVFKIVVRKNAVDTAITSFNGVFGTSGPTIDTLSTGYEIWYHGGRQFFFTKSRLIHAISPSNTTTVATLNLKSRFECFNTGVVSTLVNLQIIASAINRCAGIPSRPSYYNISSAGTNILKRGPGTLHSLIVNNNGSVGSSITIYDNTAGSGTVIAIVDTNKASVSTLSYNLDFYVGLTVVTVNGFGNVTVVWD